MPSIKSALDLLKETSRTFFIPISLLPPGLQEAVASAYLCMRAIDQIEDHPTLDGNTKTKLLRQISLNLQAGTESSAVTDFAVGLEGHSEQLDEVTQRIGEWALLAPDTIAPRIWDATAAMADRMAYWAEQNWRIKTEADLDRYTFSVAGAVGLMLSDLWAWYDGTETSRMEAIGFGRGLQSVNILRNHLEDKDRGVDFFPEGWTADDMQRYARRNLKMADAYTQALPTGPALLFCRIPLALATATIDALAQGREKLSRADVMAIVTPLLGVGKSIELMTKV
ncbi:squalene/phytoene synthase family protein [Phormidium tenue]|uniref:Phytoene/squalene synthase family protein n=1 Tax=Phormidium tenue NIES-30 TaxID=549789 RepID=A0A1U7J7V4_9CYAN|nr:phytoene/squalene synthase family protein [Phormidium tenue]MBD2231153.1 phytoene/squalene synthase family protein [Phormidium tenue FACHB-1052]OKH49409.1 phytoene/squalene synthase family protein [Phormidium tenue NIES-30]